MKLARTSLTEHGYERLKERTGKKGRSAYDLVGRAYEKGKKIEDYTDTKIIKYLTNILNAYSASELRVFGNDIYLFGNAIDEKTYVIITVFEANPKVMQRSKKRK